jgi:hypothetical protein
MQRTARAPAPRPVRQTVALDGGPAGRPIPGPEPCANETALPSKGLRMSLDISAISPTPWQSVGRRDPDRARLYRAVFQHRTELATYYPWVYLPQWRGAFKFGELERPCPMGALILLWERWPLLRGGCLECKAPALGISFGGYLIGGSIGGICLGCDLLVSRRIAGTSPIRSGVEPILKNTPFYLRSGYGVGSSGAPAALIAVLQELGATDLPAANSPSFQTKGAESEEAGDPLTKKAIGLAQPKRSRPRAARAPTKGPRRYVVKEVVSSMAWSGAIWAVGCSSRESAERALKKRVARNMAEVGEPGAVMAFDREIRCLVSWSDGVADPQAAVRWWLR